MEREVVSVAWHQRSQRIEVTFTEGDVKTMTGSGSHSDELARMAGLVRAPSLDGTVRWVRDEGPLHHQLPMSS